MPRRRPPRRLRRDPRPRGFGGGAQVNRMAAIVRPPRNAATVPRICFGMQLAIVEFCCHVLGLDGASSGEFGETPPTQSSPSSPAGGGRGYGGDGTLGDYEAILKEESLAEDIYELPSNRRASPPPLRGEPRLHPQDRGERDDLFGEEPEPDGDRRDPRPPFFFSTQFHPEMKSSPVTPRRRSLAFVQAMRKREKVKYG